jgi:hypothetical protein
VVSLICCLSRCAKWVVFATLHHHALAPLSTGKIVPVMCTASSETKKSAQLRRPQVEQPPSAARGPQALPEYERITLWIGHSSRHADNLAISQPLHRSALWLSRPAHRRHHTGFTGARPLFRGSGGAPHPVISPLIFAAARGIQHDWKQPAKETRICRCSECICILPVTRWTLFR